MVTATAGQNADIVVSAADGSSNLVRLKLVPGSWEEDPVTPTLPPVAQGDINYAARSPEFGRVFSQSNWTGGFGESKCLRTTDCDLYGYTDGVLAMFDGELIPGYREDEVDAIVQNGRMETGDTTGWTDGTNTTVALSSDGRTGSFSLSMTADANGGTATQNYLGTDSVLQSIEVTLVAYVKRLSGSGTIKSTLADGVGSDDSSTTSNTAWQLIEVTRTLDASTSAVQFTFTLSTSGDVFLVDDVAVILTGGSEFKSRPVEFGGSYYGTMGRSIIKWSESSNVWLPVFVDTATEMTSIESFTSNLYAGRGTSDNYLTSSDGTTWSDPATNSGNARLAVFFARVKNARGDWALMKTRANQVSLTSDPSDTANWGTEIQVGDADRAVTSLTTAVGTAYVGREDGLFPYNRTTNQFEDIEPDANFFPSSENFSHAIGRSGSIWASGGQQTFWNIAPTGRGIVHDWKNLSGLLKASAFKGFGGTIAGLAQDRSNVFIALADNAASAGVAFPYTFPFAFSTSGISLKIQLLSLRNQESNIESDQIENPVPHTITSFSLTALDQLGRLDDGSVSSLFAMGTFTDSDISATDKDVPRVIRLRFPRDNENPRRNSAIQTRKSAKFYTPQIDFGFPDAEKAQISLSIGSKNFSSGAKYVIVRYKTDDDTEDDGTGWTVWGDDGIFDTSPLELKAAVLTTPVTFKRIRFEVEFVSDSFTEDPPTVTSMVLQAAWNEKEPRKFRGSVKLSDRKSLQLRRVPQTVLRSSDVTSLTALRKLAFIQLVTPDGESVNAKLAFIDRTIGRRVDALRGTPVDQVRQLDLEFTEYLTS